MGFLDLFRRAEPVEARAGLTDTYIAGLTALATGDRANALRSAAVEVAAGIWGRTLAAARVEGDTTLSPLLLDYVGRELILEGEALLALRGRTAIPARISDLTREGYYRLEYTRPPGVTVHSTYRPSMVLHFRWAIDPQQHWRGIGPYSRAVDASQLAANVEVSLREESTGPRALILPLPAGEHATADLAADIAAAKGGAVMAESTAAGWDAGRQAGSVADWKAQRLGPAPPAEVLQLHRQAFEALLALAGIPPSMGIPNQADGTRLREDYRRFALASVAPVARGIEEEMALKGRPARLRFEALHAHDIQGRSSALGNLVNAGVELSEARRLTGLD